MATRTRNRGTNTTSKIVISQQTEQEPTYNEGESEEFEFGGSFGAASLMIGFPLLMWYMWIGATYYNGQFPTPGEDQTWKDFAYHMSLLVYNGAYPTTKAWVIFWFFFVLEALMCVACVGSAKY
jgi:delta24(24(1))-sterol reductase